MTSDRLLTEVERQKKYLSRLPKDFKYPLFNTKRALESQRRSGYRSTASAGREIVDNAIEAQASEVHAVFQRQHERGKGKGSAVSAIAFIDNGAGMTGDMVRYALSWGGGTHFDEPNFIGKFGFGLPNASINQTKRVEVYSRVEGTAGFSMTYLDVKEFAEHEVQSIPPTQLAELPSFVQEYLTRNHLKLDHGTVVLWVNPDRLTYRTPDPLKTHLVDDFGVTYRYLLAAASGERSGSETLFKLVVEGVHVLPTDPLFLESRSRLYLDPEKGGALPTENLRAIPVRYYRDPETGQLHLTKMQDVKEIDEPGTIAGGAIAIRVARFPVGFVESKRGRPAKDGLTEAQRRFEIRKARRGMSFVRASREIETVDAFPRRASDIASGMGKWPLLQGYAYHWGIEVRFDPDLDEVFGITNDKQQVRPIEDFWRLLASEKVDDLLRRENAWQAEQRRTPPEIMVTEIASPAEIAARAANTATGRRSSPPDRSKKEANLSFEREAQRQAKLSDKTIDDIRKALEEEAKRRPYKVEYVEVLHGPFYEPVWVGPQAVVRVNRSHPFFTTFYGSLLKLSGSRLAKEALDLFLLTLGQAELSVDDEQAAEWYKIQRESVWNLYLATGMRTLAATEMPTEEETEEAA